MSAVAHEALLQPEELASSARAQAGSGPMQPWQLLLSMCTSAQQKLGVACSPMTRFGGIMSPLLCCKRRGLQGGTIGRSVAFSGHCELPDFVIWPAAAYLVSKDLGKLARTNASYVALLSHEAFLPDFLRERRRTLGISQDLATLEQVHLAEEVVERKQLRLVFGMMSDTIPEEAELGLRSLINLVQMHPKAIVQLEGHTSAGPFQLAESVSRRRTEAVGHELERLGLKREQLTMSWFRDERLLQNYSDPYDPEHRRVEVFVSLQGVRFKL